MKNADAPKTLVEAIRLYSDPDVCLATVVAMRWPNGVTCPECGSTEVTFLANQRRWKCRTNHPKRQFSVKVGTIFEDSPIGLDKWLAAIWMVANCKNGISSYEMARDLGVTQKTAWFMNHRIRLAMQSGGMGPMGGEVEVDETFIGGRARNMHAAKRRERIKGTGSMSGGKAAVMGLLERHGPDGHSRVRTKLVPSTKRKVLDPVVREHVTKGAAVYTDAHASYDALGDEYTHKVVDHAECYVKGRVHTNGMENFWSLLKRSIKGTYVSVEPFHLFRYLDEQSFRFNTRKGKDGARFLMVAGSIAEKRLTYKQLTGKTQVEASPA